MALKIYNTLTHEKDPFVPIEPGRVKMYVCGVTVYDSCHIGHARAAVVFDVIYRFFRRCGFEVTYIRNFTDIDDKIIKRAQDLNISYQDLTAKYIEEYSDEMKQMNVLEPTVQPKATENIQEMIQLIQGLINKGFAYAAGGDVYYEVSKFLPYGKLSRRTLEELLAGARINPGEKKTHPEDFALWKGAKPGEPFWQSPWGEGRPGWHIECSAMSMKHIGETLDVHGGGSDLIFPHHENEIAQSEAYTGKPFARYWVHNEMITVDQTKMSKSLGNVCVLSDLLKKYPARLLRLFIVSKHYRTPMDFSFEGLEEARHALERIEATLARAQESLEGLSLKVEENRITREWDQQFMEAMEDDFNTPKALGVLFKLVGELNAHMDQKSDLEAVGAEFAALKGILETLGIQTDLKRFRKIKDTVMVDEKRIEEILNQADLDDEDLEYLVKARESARRLKKWNLADGIRESLKSKGYEIQDEKDGAKVVKLKG